MLMAMTNKELSFREQFGVKKRVSVVWEYFDKTDKYKSTCKLCGHQQNCQGTTGNLLRHLKAKHNIHIASMGINDIQMIDSTIADELSAILNCDGYSLIDNDYNFIDGRTNKHKAPFLKEEPNMIYDESDTDPEIYTDSTINFEQYIDSTTNPTKRKRKYTVEEERVLAEIEYFREKAGYYRMQRNLTVLEAKKVRYELDHMESNQDDESNI